MSVPSAPIISIVTPTYNSERFIEATIRSVMAQGIDRIEHLVIDGGSTDRTLDIVRQYPHVHLVTEPDRGMYDALNKGLRMATGPVIGCVNSDDQYEAGALRAVLEFLEAHPSCDVVFGDTCFVDEQNQPLYVQHALPFKWQRFASMDFCSLMFPSVFWRRRIHDRIGYFDDAYRMAADFDFYLRFKGLDVRCLNQPLSRFRIHGASLTYTRSDLSRREVARILEHHGIPSGSLMRLRQQVAKFLYLIVCFRPPLVMVRRGLRKLWSARA